MYGDKGRIALLRPGITPSTEMDFHNHIPEGVAISTCGVEYDRVTPQGLQAMSDKVAACAARYRGFPMDLMVFACTTGSMVGGPGYDKRLIAQMEAASGIPAITTTTALLEAFSAMGLKRLSIVTPYSVALDEMEERFLASEGIETRSIKGLGHEDIRAVPFVRPEEMYALAISQETQGSDAMFISCTGICVLDIIEPLEAELDIPVITSNQASIWCALRRLGFHGKLHGLGRLGDR